MLYSLDFKKNSNIGTCFMISFNNILCDIDDIRDFSWCERVDISDYSDYKEFYIFIKCNCLRHKRSIMIDLDCLDINDIQVFDSSKYDRLTKFFKCKRVTSSFKLNSFYKKDVFKFHSSPDNDFYSSYYESAYEHNIEFL